MFSDEFSNFLSTFPSSTFRSNASPRTLTSGKLAQFDGRNLAEYSFDLAVCSRRNTPDSPDGSRVRPNRAHLSRALPSNIFNNPLVPRGVRISRHSYRLRDFTPNPNNSAPESSLKFTWCLTIFYWLVMFFGISRPQTVWEITAKSHRIILM